MGNIQRQNEAEAAAQKIRQAFGLPEGYDHAGVGLVLGTGWGDALNIENRQELDFREIGGFQTLGSLEGHARKVVYGTIAGKEVLALQGRVHLNEGHTPDIPLMVRLQTEMLLRMGVRNLIVTSAVGSLRKHVAVGDIAIVESFITLFAPAMPLWAGEFCSPEDMLDPNLVVLAANACGASDLQPWPKMNHAMVRGPFFEGRKNDKGILKRLGADVVGMSMLPEACVAAVYGVKVLGLGFVTNNDTEVHSHEDNIARAKKNQAKLASLLDTIVHDIPNAG